jgi:hypothetical protein
LRVLWLFVFVLPHAFPSVSRANDSFTNLLGITLPKSPVCVSEYDQNMRLGSRGPDVIELQKILNISPDTRLTDVGPGSPGGETDYFGPLTHNAVVRFQEKYAAEILVPAETVQGTGFVGAYTRRKVKEVCSVLSSGMTSEDLTAAAILGFNKVFYRHLKSYKKTSSTTPWFPTSGGVGSSAPAPSASSPDSGQTTAPSTGTSGGSSGSSSSSAGGSPAGNQTPTPAPSPEPEPTSTSTPPAPTPAPAPAPTPTTTPISSEYPWHRNITAAVFWVGEPQGGGSSEDNALSAWDAEWQKHYGGYDEPQWLLPGRVYPKRKSILPGCAVQRFQQQWHSEIKSYDSCAVGE